MADDSAIDGAAGQMSDMSDAAPMQMQIKCPNAKRVLPQMGMMDTDKYNAMKRHPTLEIRGRLAFALISVHLNVYLSQ